MASHSTSNAGETLFVRAKSEPTPLTHQEQEALASRMGIQNLARRLDCEEKLLAKKRHFQRYRKHLRILSDKDALLAFLLQRAGLWRRGRKLFRAIHVVKNEVHLAGLPEIWDGFRLLQISDLHIDIDPGLLRPLLRILENLPFDQAVLTGDFQDLLLRPHDPVVEAVAKLLPFLGPSPLAIPGNHDLASLVVKLEALGLRFLLNEHEILKRGSSQLAVVGVDNPQVFGGDDLARALSGIPPAVTRILLVHSPSFYSNASRAGIDLLLCGHTHGGQICLPGGIPLVRNAKVPPSIFAGAWRWENLQGYTSRGTGGCGVPVRFFCPPEVTLHTLRCK